MTWFRSSGIFAVAVVLVGCSPVIPQGGSGSVGDGESAGVQEGGIASEGDCVAIGHGNEQNCTIITLPATVEEFGGISLKWDVGAVYFDGPVEELPVPVSYPKREEGDPEPEWNPEDGAPVSAMNHCSLWEDWYQEDERIYRIYPSIYASLWGGADELVAITGVSAQVFDRPEPSGEGVVIMCIYGAGSNYGAMINVNTESLETTLTHHEEPEMSGLMPPASVSLNGGSVSPTLETMIYIDSPRYLYSGLLTVDGRVGDETPYVHIGTPEKPIRWTGELGYAEAESAPRYGWNAETQEWVEGFHPGMLGSLDWY